MKKRAEDIYHKLVGKVLSAKTEVNAMKELASLISFADLLDQAGETTDADHVDKVATELSGLVKQAQWLSALLSGGGDALKNLWTRSQEGKPLFSKDALVDIITNALMTGGIALLVDELVKTLEEHIPILNWLVGKDKLNFVLTGVLTYAVKNTNFVHGIVDGLEMQIGKIFGIEMKEQKPEQKKQEMTTAPMKPVAEDSKPKEEEKQTFQVAPAGVKG